MKIHTHKLQKTIKNTLIAMGIMLFLAIAGGVAYVYYTGKQVEKAPASEVVAPVEESPIFEPRKPSPNAPESASVQYLASPVKAGENSTITVTTGPDSACTIIIAYNNVVSKDSGLVPKTADIHGSVSWAWTVDKTAPAGKWPVKVTCVRNSKTAYVEGYLEVIK